MGGTERIFFSGASDTILPEYVKSQKAALYDARKTSGPVATGAVGVLTYYMKDVNKTLGVLFSVPFDYNLYSNWWDAKVYKGKKMADNDMYKDLYYGDPFKGDDSWKTKQIGEGYSLKGFMSSSGTCELEVRIS